MIPQTTTIKTYQNWQQALADTVNTSEELLHLLGLSGLVPVLDKDKLGDFPVRVPRSYVNKMRYGDPTDPLFRQVFPFTDEGHLVEGYSSDPVGDHQAIKTPGILHKYQGRALLLMTGACAIHCRYCFRRHFPYSDSNPLASQWQQSLNAIAADTSIREVILSGGDPLSLTDKKLAAAVEDLATIPHLKRLRIHTRLPVVLAERVTDSLLDWIRHSRLKVVMVIHANHQNELDEATAHAIDLLKQAGVQMLNQTVLLKGINDSVDTLVALSERLNEIDVMPYYIHLLDKVAGAHHFDMDEAEAVRLIDETRKQLPGYLVPRLVREQQGEASKTIIR